MVPTAGMSGNVVVVDRLQRIGASRAVALAALIMTIIAYYASYGVASFAAVGKGVPALSGGSPATSVGVPEHNSRYQYDAATGTYGKVEDGHTMADAALGRPT